MAGLKCGSMWESALEMTQPLLLRVVSEGPAALLHCTGPKGSRSEVAKSRNGSRGHKGDASREYTRGSETPKAGGKKGTVFLKRHEGNAICKNNVSPDFSRSAPVGILHWGFPISCLS
jgi:hypothetical protein